MPQTLRIKSSGGTTPTMLVAVVAVLLVVFSLWFFQAGGGEMEVTHSQSGTEQPAVTTPAESAAPVEIPQATGSKRLRTRSVPDPIEIQEGHAVPDPVEIQK